MRNDLISVIIPVMHEGMRINSLIDHIRSCERGKKAEIIVVEGSRSGDTLKALRRPGVKRIYSPRGRSVQMNRGAEKASGSILVFLHADTMLPDDGMDLIIDTMEDQEYSAGAFSMRMPDAPWILKALVPINVMRSRLTRIPYGDQAIFFRRSSFFDLGGYREIMLMEDIDIMRRTRKAGLKIKVLNKPVTTSGRRFRENGPLKTLVTNIFLVILYRIGFDPDRLARVYYST